VLHCVKGCECEMNNFMASPDFYFRKLIQPKQLLIIIFDIREMNQASLHVVLRLALSSSH
jgi:hypothetical protein